MDSKKSKQAIENLRRIHEESLILNPTENIPFSSDVNLDFLEGMYISEEKRNENSKVIFAGRENINELYGLWCEYMDAKAVTFKPHSGLGAHISLFMSLGKIGVKRGNITQKNLRNLFNLLLLLKPILLKSILAKT